jgi:glycine/D-amino acid oxidase-like deaminating enzyme
MRGALISTSVGHLPAPRDRCYEIARIVGDTSMQVVICGGGVIGAAAAYELSRRGMAVTVIERWRVAGAASGKSGGFLARDWCRGTPVAPLAERSFDLHAAWAHDLGDRYGYRRVDTFAVTLSDRPADWRKHAPTQGVAGWLAADISERSPIGNRHTTAQIDPEAFTKALIEAASSQGASLTIGTVTGIRRSRDGTRVAAVVLEDGRDFSADAVIIAMGPWSVLAARWLAMPAVYGLKGHSLVFRPKAMLPSEAVFAEFEDAEGEVYTPEIVPRADGTLYICGLSGSAPLPLDPSEVAPEPGGCEKLRAISERLVPVLGGAEVLARQACHRPITADGLPLIGPVRQLAGAYVATGHSVWGMLNAPGTAEALGELIVDGGSQHLNLEAFLPSRLPELDPKALSIGSSEA